MPQTRWYLTDAVLVEARADGTVRYWGRWDAEFGLRDHGGRPVEPDRQPLGRLGLWVEPEGERDDEWYASRAALAAYWSAVPTGVRLKAAPHSSRQWELLLEAWSQSSLTARVRRRTGGQAGRGPSGGVKRSSLDIWPTTQMKLWTSA